MQAIKRLFTSPQEKSHHWSLCVILRLLAMKITTLKLHSCRGHSVNMIVPNLWSEFQLSVVN